MCGIIGYVGDREAAPVLLEGLRRLEYRGYDSAGLAVLEEDGSLCVHKRAGKLDELARALQGAPPRGNLGIGHTRWATHGRPTDANAHPVADCSGRVLVVHNGIIENYRTLKEWLQGRGHRFATETDTEVIAHLVEEGLANGQALPEATRAAVSRLQGANAVLVVSSQWPQGLVAARLGNAGGVVIGLGQGECLVASDLPALLPYTRRVIFLSGGEMAQVSRDGVCIYTLSGQPVSRQPVEVPYDPLSVAKGPYKHFMLKEMMEQPECVLDTVRGRVDFESMRVELEDVDLPREVLSRLRRVVLVGMGTSYHAALVGRHYMETIARLPAEAENASEFRYRDPLVGPDTLVVAVTQSGETVDTLAAMEEARRKGCTLAAVCNVIGSQASRLADCVVYTRCGLEVGVCSTKTFTASLVVLYLLACYLAQARGTQPPEVLTGLLSPLARLPYLLGELTERAEEYERLAHLFYRFGNFLYLGRGIQYPIALEGALKLKEVSYIHAEGYPAGEMKHGPIALIDQDMPVVAIAVRDHLYDKMRNNLEQVKAREGRLIVLASEGDEEMARLADHVVGVPEAPPLLLPVLTAVPLQFFAYYIALRRGCDVDQPRNLAKTVTVE
jgi:glucosamine--fructose-6-phosphate aminotransferase (isomerizing)